jgi:uncharacterized membrane protein
MSCGADARADRFCATCGKQVAQAPPTTSDLPENAACLLCYALWALTGVIFLVIEPYSRSKLVRFHAWQSILTSVVLFAGWFVVLIAASILRLLPWIGVPLALIVVNVFGLAMTALWILLMFKAYQGGSLSLPWISRFAQKQA